MASERSENEFVGELCGAKVAGDGGVIVKGLACGVTGRLSGAKALRLLDCIFVVILYWFVPRPYMRFVNQLSVVNIALFSRFLV
jgi:hypothetical protein